MDKVTGLDEWNLSTVADAQQVATVSVFVPYPEVTKELIRLAPADRRTWITQTMRAALDDILAHNLLANYKLLKRTGQRERYYGVQGEISVANLQKLTALDAVKSVRVESATGQRRKPTKPRRRSGFYCVKMTVAIQVEGMERGMQTYEERHVLYRAYSEADALRRAETTTAEYGKPYLNSDDLLVRWKIESLDAVYEVVLESGEGSRSLDRAEVFSVLKSRKITPERAWLKAE